MGIDRCNARRGTPSVIWSDNGTYSVGAEKKVRTCIQCKIQHISLTMIHKKLTWKFNRPGGLLQGASRERFASCKRLFYTTSGTWKLIEDVYLSTVCLWNKQTVNARTLRPVNSDSNNKNQLSMILTTGNASLAFKHMQTPSDIVGIKNTCHCKTNKRKVNLPPAGT